MKILKLVSFLGMLVLISPMLAFGAGTACGTDTHLVADGRILDFDFIAPGTTGFYRVDLVAGRSYSIEVRQDFDVNNTDLTISVLSGACPGAAVVVNNTANTEPSTQVNAFRGSFVPASTGTFHISVVHGNGAGVGRYVSVSVSDTTVFNPRWSTFATFITQWGFLNTTGTSLTGTLTVIDSVSGGPYTKQVTIPPGPTVFVTTTDTFTGGPIPNAHAGSSFFTHNGPPGSILTDCFFVSGNAQVIVPSRFEAVRSIGR